MRPSRRTEVLDAAIRLAGTAGIRGLTVDAVAAEADVTKAGVLYHFRSRDELVAAVLDHIAESWDRRVADRLGTDPADAPQAERVAAFAGAVAADAPSAAELAILVDALRQVESRNRWRAFRRRWTEDPPGRLSVDQRIALLAADGLWLNEATGSTDLDADDLERVRRRIRDLAHHD